MAPKATSDAFVAGLGAGAAAPPDDLADRLDSLIARARSEFPEVELEPIAFLSHVAARVGAGGADPFALAGLRAGPLHLAAAILAGDAQAPKVFERVYFGVLRAVLARMLPVGERDEVEQLVRCKIFLGTGGGDHSADGHPRIADYTGHRDIQPWLHVIAARTAVDNRRAAAARAGHEVAGGLTVEDVFADAAASPELALVRAQHGALLKQAFNDAVSELPPATRTLLRQHVLDGLTIDDLAALHDVHRATASRWLVQARLNLAEGLRAQLAAAHGMSPASIESLLRRVTDTLELSIERVLADG